MSVVRLTDLFLPLAWFYQSKFYQHRFSQSKFSKYRTNSQNIFHYLMPSQTMQDTKNTHSDTHANNVNNNNVNNNNANNNNANKQNNHAMIRLYAEKILQQANQKLGTNYPMPNIYCNLKGKTAGLAYLTSWEIRLNSVMLAQYGEVFLQEVLPHEMAHLFVYRYFTIEQKRKAVKPHGNEWKTMMLQVFEQEPKRTHNFEYEQKTVITFEYRCHCQAHYLSIRRHNKVQRLETRYICKRCKQLLSFHG